MDKPDLYAALGVRRNASAATIRKAYRRKAAHLHPDKNPGDPEAEAAYRAVTEAYEVLSDPARRRKYDETGDATRSRGEQKEILDFLVPRLMQTVQDQVTARGHKRNSLVAALSRKIKDDRDAAEQSAKNLEWTAGELREVASRLSSKGGENLLAAVVTSQADRVSDQVKLARAEAALCQKALDFLDGYSYRVDGVDPDADAFGKAMRKMIGMSGAWVLGGAP